MKRKFAMMVLVATMAASMMTGCGAKSDNVGAAQQEETTQQEGTATEGQSEETSTFTGTLDEVKDFMFVVTGEDGSTSREGIFAGGDASTGAATVILAMGAGKHAAASIDEYIKNKSK